jgi:hypothetical protein
LEGKNSDESALGESLTHNREQAEDLLLNFGEKKKKGRRRNKSGA